MGDSSWTPLPLADLFAVSVATAQTRLEDPLDALLPEEEAAIGRARPERLTEFRAGRHAARRALAELGLSPHPIARDPDRAPVWPSGVAGSITHVRRGGIGWAAAAAARSETWSAVGIDAELDAPLEEALWRRVLTGTELERLSALPAAERGLQAKVIFSAKECVYKCQYPLTRQFLEFSEVQVDLFEGGFRARFGPESVRRAVGDALEGRTLRQGGLVVTGAALPHR